MPKGLTRRYGLGHLHFITWRVAQRFAPRRMKTPPLDKHEVPCRVRGCPIYRSATCGVPLVCGYLTPSKDAGNLVLSLRTILGAARILANGASRHYHGTVV